MKKKEELKMRTVKELANMKVNELTTKEMAAVRKYAVVTAKEVTMRKKVLRLGSALHKAATRAARLESELEAATKEHNEAIALREELASREATDGGPNEDVDKKESKHDSAK